MKLLRKSVLPLALLLAVFSHGCGETQHGAPPQQRTAETASLRVGHVDMERLFQSYTKTESFYEKAEEIQMKFQELGEEDFEQMMSLQIEFQALQSELFQGFQADVEQTAEELAGKMHLDMVAVEILHQSENAELIDVTSFFLETEFFSGGHVHTEACEH